MPLLKEYLTKIWQEKPEVDIKYQKRPYYGIKWHRTTINGKKLHQLPGDPF
jgi:hypothetical protein